MPGKKSEGVQIHVGCSLGHSGAVERCALRAVASSCFGLMPDIIVPFSNLWRRAVIKGGVVGKVRGS